MKLTKSIHRSLLGLGICALAAFAQTPGAFTATGIMTRPRQFHTATLLPNGKVLITGGSATSQPCEGLASSELYDPSTGTFTPSGDMTEPRHMHTATLLPNGKVLVAGGQSMRNAGFGCLSSILQSAELYDPTTGTFTATGDMITARGWHTATLLNNGKVFIAGGYFGSSALSGAELYDSSTGTFSPTVDMTEPGAETATLLPNGKVLITRNVGFLKTSHAELYDSVTGTYTRTGDMIDPNQGEQPTALLLTNGKVLIAAGSLEDFGGSTSAEIYDPASGTFNATGKLTASIDAWQAAALLPEGRVLIAGQSDYGCLSSSGVCIGTAELFDPVAGTFSAPIQSQSMEGHTATLLPDGTLLLSGGWVYCTALPIGLGPSECGGTIAAAQIYHPVVLVPAPQLFSVSGDGKGQGAIWHGLTGELASPSSPAVAGEILSMYTTGLADGGAIPPQVAVGGRLAEVLYFGVAPGYPGYDQVNIRMPSGVAPGPSVAVRLTYIGRPSNAVTIGSLLAPLSPISVTSVRNAASNVSGPVAPGEIVVLGGFALGPAQLTSSIPGSDGLYGNRLAGTTVQINGTPAPLIYTWATQVATIIPDSISGSTAEITVISAGVKIDQ